MLDQRRVELVGNRAMHQHALRADAALPSVTEAGHLDLGGRGAPIAVGFDDARRVVAEFEANPFARCPCPNAPADFWRAGKRDESDVWVVNDRVAHRASPTGDDLQVLRRQPALLDQHLGQCQTAERGLAGWLEYHRATRRNGRANLVHHQIQRKVKRCNRTNDADRDSQREAQLPLAGGDGIERNHLATQLARLGGSELERASSPFGLDPCSLDRLGRFPGHDLCELLAPFRQTGCSPIENLGPLPQRQRVRAQRRFRNRHRPVHIGCGLRRDLTNEGIVVRRTNSDHVGHVQRRYWAR